MNIYLTPLVQTPARTPLFATPQLPVPPTATTLSSQPINLTGSDAPVVWVVQAKESLTLWLGYFSTSPQPNVASAHPIVQWGKDIILADEMKISPDGKSLALITIQDYHQESGNPEWLWIVDLTTNKAQLTPNPANPAAHFTYADVFSGSLVGWLDNEHLLYGISPQIATKAGSASTPCNALPASAKAQFMAIAPDRSAIFADVQGVSDDVRGYWIFDANCSKAEKIIDELHNNRTTNLLKGLPATYSPQWSPNGKYISFVGPGFSAFTKSYIWLLDRSHNTVEPIDAEDATDFAPTWLPTSTNITFLRADSPLKAEDSYKDVTSYASNLYMVDLNSREAKKMTNFQKVQNASPHCTSDGKYIVMLSTYDNQIGNFGLIAVSTNSGAATTLIQPNASEQIVYSLLLKLP